MSYRNQYPPGMAHSDSAQNLKDEHGGPSDYSNGDYYMANSEYTKPAKKGSSKYKWIIIGLVLLACVAAGAVLGGIFGSRAANKNKSDEAGASADQQAGAASTDSNGASTTGGSRATSTESSATSTQSPSAAGNFAVTPLARWDWATDKSIGVCLGSWLLLERWMYEDWFIGEAGPDAWDEWDFSLNLGPDRAKAALEEHYNTFITEDDIDTVFQHGVNMIRIPTGFWTWIPTLPDEPYVYAGQRDQVTKMMGWAYERGMRVVIDLHGLPGSQNGEQTSGHNTTNPHWYNNATNQARSDDTVQAVLTFIENHAYRSTVAAIEVINEPRPYTPEQVQQLQDYYTRAYNLIQASSYPVPMIFAGGYVENELEYWQPWAAQRATTPPSLIYEDHPYPGNFPPQTDVSNILSQVCAAGQKYRGYPIPIVISEWSLYTGVKDQGFEQQFYESQLATYGWSAGSMYWTLRLIPSSLQLQAGLDYSQYSFITVIQNNTATIPRLTDFNLPNATTRENALAYMSNMQTNCGSQPANAAPYNTGDVPVWSVEVAAQSSAATIIMTATTGAAATATGRARFARHF